jgi:hypothetical protein
MKRSFPSLAVLAAVILVPLAASAAENATVTEGSIPLMVGPSFIVEEVPGVATVKGQRIEVVSRTSFTDYLAAIPENYWYLVRFTNPGSPVTGYLHGSVLALDPGATVPVFDPPGFAPKPKVASGGNTVTSAVSGRCVKTEGVLTVPKGSTATHFTISRFDSSFTSCPDGGYGSIIGFSIVSAADLNREFFSYDESIADDPAGLQYQRDGFYYMDLDPGSYIVTIRGGPDTALEITYDLTVAR